MKNVSASNPQATARYWPVAVGLLVLILTLLTAAYVMNLRARPSAQGTAAAFTQDAATIAPQTGASPATSSLATAQQGAVPLDKQIEQAYLHYWDVYSEALLTLDASKAPQVAADSELQSMQAEIDGFRQKGKAVRVTVKHHYLIFDTTATDAKVYDEIDNSSFLVDPSTKQPSQGSNQTDLEKDTYFFKNIDGSWKVVRTVRGASN